LKTPVCQIAIETPLRRLFDYHPVPGAVPGARVRVPFGRQHLVGIVVSHMSHSDVPAEKLRSIEAVLDPAPLFSAADLKLLQWAAEYYHHPVGEVFATALPRLLRQGRDVAPVRRSWRITDAGRAALAQGALQRAHRQQQLLGHIATTGECDESALEAAVPGWRPLARALRDKSLLEFHEQSLTSAASGGTQPVETGPVLTGAQLAAVETLTAPGLAGAFLLDGITGSGKTEVYLRGRAHAGARRRALVLVPEIGLTPQLVSRFAARFAGRAARAAALGPYRWRSASRLAPGRSRAARASCSARARRCSRRLAGPRPDRRRRGTRCLVQAAGQRLPLFRAGPRAACAHRRSASR
jgi:primosomal protein N' (replication factor Y)